MNIKITDSWLREYLETDATPVEIGKYLSLCGPSVERVEKIDDDYVYDIEITTNRIDTASVFGIAQEARAILPRFGKKARLRNDPLRTYVLSNLNAEPSPIHEIKVDIQNHGLVPRFTACVFNNIEITNSPDFIQKRLKLVGISVINNVIDISNYIMVELGQPSHMFDYDSIEGGVLKLRESTKGETITTLDGKRFELPGGDIVIEDGSGKIIDLCGIMGGQNSSITPNTKRVLFFVQTYDKKHIRKTSMNTGQRTMAATYFEKGLDPARVETAFVYGVHLLQKFTAGTITSNITDLVTHTQKKHQIVVHKIDIDRLIGVTIPSPEIENILMHLGFGVKKSGLSEKSIIYHVDVPSYRTQDIEIKEDIIEEVARVYGYHNLESNLSPLVYLPQPKEIIQLFDLQHKIKHMLKYQGLTEAVNYSMISSETLKESGIESLDHLAISNTISEEIKHMRTTLIPSLIKNVKQNEGKKESMSFFEIAKVYLPRNQDLPDEKYKLGIVSTTDFYELKGIVEGIFDELHINARFEKNANPISYLSSNTQAQILDLDQNVLGYIGKIASPVISNFELSRKLVACELDMSGLAEKAKVISPYVVPTIYSVVKLDLNVTQNSNITFTEIVKRAKKTSKLLSNVKLVTKYKNVLNLRLYFNSTNRNITEAEAMVDLENIKKAICG